MADHLTLRIYGTVQGVFFRQSTQEKAQELNLTGFVRNERDGSVYVEAEGDPPSLGKLREFRDLHQGLLDKYEHIDQWLRTAQADHPGLPYWLVTVGYGRHLSKALLTWGDETASVLESIEDTQGPRAEAATQRRERHG